MKKKKYKGKYDEILTADSFDIVIKCKHCQAVGCFIGIKDLDEGNSSVDTTLLNLLRGDGTSIDIICANCGHIENCY